MSRKSFNKFGNFGKSLIKKHKSVSSKELSDRIKSSPQIELVLNQIKEINQYPNKINDTQRKWIKIILDATIKQTSLSSKQLDVIKNIYNKIVPEKKLESTQKKVEPVKEIIESTKNLEVDINNYDYYVYTDGSFDPVVSKGSLAFVILDYNKNKIFEFSLVKEDTTSNRMEYEAFIYAVEYIKKSIPNYDKQKILIQSDSQLLVNTYNDWMMNWHKKDWKRNKSGTKEIKNLDLVKQLFNIKNEFSNLKLSWIRGHNGNQWNEYVDQMTQEAYNNK